jgi:nitroreductase
VTSTAQRSTQVTHEPGKGTLPDRDAVTDAPLVGLLAHRWSPRGFDSTTEITPADLTTLLEAARWSPSAGNSQPWRFIVGRRGGSTFERIAALLAPGNQTWAPQASVLMVAVVATVDDAGEPQRWAFHDTGQAMAHLTVQAESMGLRVHQMGGVDAPGVIAEFGLAAGLEPIAAAAIGTLDADAPLPDYLAEREPQPRVRRPLAQLLLAPVD